MSDQEEWRDITEPDFAGMYMVSNRGRVAKVLRGGFSRSTGYTGIILSRRGVAYRAFRLHQLIAWAFNGPQPEDTVVNHRDGDKTNNDPANLEYVTQRENVRHGIRMGLRGKITKNVRNGQFLPVLTVDQVGEIKALLIGRCPVDLIAKDYGVSTESIRRIKLGRNWNRVPAKP